MSTQPQSSSARVGDLVAAHQISGGAPRRGRIIEILGHEGHEHYRVQWNDGHESICYPADGVTITHRRPQHAAQA
jgi:uncharacterized protein DUF1918